VFYIFGQRHLYFILLKMLTLIVLWNTILIAVAASVNEVYTQPEQIHLSYGGKYYTMGCESCDEGV